MPERDLIDAIVIHVYHRKTSGEIHKNDVMKPMWRDIDKMLDTQSPKMADMSLALNNRHKPLE